MKKALFTLALTLVGLLAQAQEKEAIVTDRPTQTPASSVMPAGAFQFESGFLMEETRDVQSFLLPNLLFRYGVNEFFELRLQQDYLHVDTPFEDASGLSSLRLGTKVKMADEQGWKPQMSFLFNVTLPTGEDPFKNDFYSSDFSVVFSNTLGDRMTLGYSFGFITGEFGLDTSVYTIVLSYAVSNKLTGFIEPYGFGTFTENRPDQRFNAGLIYLPSTTFQLDVSAGTGITAISPDYFVSLGVSCLF